MNLNISDEYFGELLPFIQKESITDITWNGRDLWLDDLEKGRYKANVKLSDQFVQTFSTRIANLANKNFNLSEPLLEAETDNLRISIVDDTVTNTNRSIAIRKTPAVRRLTELKMLESGYAEALVLKLLKALVRGHSSVIVTGDVGSGKTELIKYLTKFIPTHERTISIEDNYELRLSAICPKLDCVEIKASQDGPFSYQMAIKAALRQLCKWLLMAEARSKEVVQLLEAASTGCIVMTTLHSDDVRKIPDRVVNMMGIDGEEKRNDVYNFFDVGLKVGIQKTPNGIKRSIDQICVLDRDNNENSLYLIYNKGFTGQTLPRNLWQKVVEGAKEEIELFEFLKPEDADVKSITETPEFANMVKDLEKSMREDLIEETKVEELEETFGETETSSVDELSDIFEEAREEVELDELLESTPETFDDMFGELNIEAYLEDIPADEYEREELEDAESEIAESIDEFEEGVAEEFEEFSNEPEDIETIEEELDTIDIEELFKDNATDIDDLLGIFEHDEYAGFSRSDLISELKKQTTINWIKGLSKEELAEELKREVSVVEECNELGIPIPEEELLKIKCNLEAL